MSDSQGVDENTNLASQPPSEAEGDDEATVLVDKAKLLLNEIPDFLEWKEVFSIRSTCTWCIVSFEDDKDARRQQSLAKNKTGRPYGFAQIGLQKYRRFRESLASSSAIWSTTMRSKI